MTESTVTQPTNQVRNHLTRSASLTDLPPEIRLLIWRHVFKRRFVHILEGTFVFCNIIAFETSHHIRECHHHILWPTVKCSNCPRNSIAAVASVCRQFFLEVADIRYQQTLISFASSAVCLAYIDAKLSTRHVTAFSTQRLYHVQLDLGAAKYNSANVNRQNWALLKLLAREASNINTLNLNFTWFYRATADVLPLGRKTVEHILRFRNLRQLNLRMYQVLPGPVGMSDLHEKQLMLFWLRWRCMEAILRLHVSPTGFPMARNLASSRDLICQARKLVAGRRITCTVVRDVIPELIKHLSALGEHGISV